MNAIFLSEFTLGLLWILQIDFKIKICFTNLLFLGDIIWNTQSFSGTDYEFTFKLKIFTENSIDFILRSEFTIRIHDTFCELAFNLVSFSRIHYESTLSRKFSINSLPLSPHHFEYSIFVVVHLVVHVRVRTYPTTCRTAHTRRRALTYIREAIPRNIIFIFTLNKYTKIYK